MRRRLAAGAATALLVGAGGAGGATLRYLTAAAVPGLGGTLTVNVLGSLALGFLVYCPVAAGAADERTRLLVAAGFLSSFTTYSAFAVESALSSPALLGANVAATYALGFLGVVAGRALGRRRRGWR